MDDSDLERWRRETNQRASVAKTLDGVTGPWRVTSGQDASNVERVQEVIRAVEARPGDEATATELDLRLDDWASAELKSVALILFYKWTALKIVLTNKEGEDLKPGER